MKKKSNKGIFFIKMIIFFMCIATCFLMKNTGSSLAMPVCIGELETGILSEEELEDMAARATGNDTFTVAKFKELHKQDIFEILKKANHS